MIGTDIAGEPRKSCPVTRSSSKEGYTFMAQITADHSASAAVDHPAPLGLIALALTTFLIGLASTGTASGGNSKAIMGVILFAGLLQLLAGWRDMRDGKTRDGTIIATFGALALAAGFTGSWAIGSYGYLAVAIVTLLFFLSSFGASRAWMLTLLLLFLAFAALTIGAFGAGSFTTIGGYLGMLAALVALYTAWASLLHGSSAPFHLPV